MKHSPSRGVGCCLSPDDKKDTSDLNRDGTNNTRNKLWLHGETDEVYEMTKGVRQEKQGARGSDDRRQSPRGTNSCFGEDRAFPVCLSARIVGLS